MEQQIGGLERPRRPGGGQVCVDGVLQRACADQPNAPGDAALAQNRAHQTGLVRRILKSHVVDKWTQLAHPGRIVWGRDADDRRLIDWHHQDRRRTTRGEVQ